MSENRYLTAFVVGLFFGGASLTEEEMSDSMFVFLLFFGCILRFLTIAWLLLLLIEKAFS